MTGREKRRERTTRLYEVYKKASAIEGLEIGNASKRHYHVSMNGERLLWWADLEQLEQLVNRFWKIKVFS